MDYLIWSNEHEAWWRGPGLSGYTKRLSEAGQYTHEQALRICINAIPGNAARFGLLPELPIFRADALAMQAAHHARYPTIPTEEWE